MKKQNNRGSIFILILLVSSVIIATGTTLLSTAVLNYKMKKVNSRVKKTFYATEAALEEAYVITEDFIEAAVDYAEIKGCSRAAYRDFLFGRCSDLMNHKSLVNTLKDKSNYVICKSTDTIINALITGQTNYYQLKIVSSGFDGKIEKKVDLFCKIFIPDDAFLPGSMSAEQLLEFHEWVRER